MTMTEASLKTEIKKINDINDFSVELILDEKVEEALKKLKNAEKMLEKIIKDVDIEKKSVILILHNIACCYQKMKNFENCVTYLEAVIYHYDGTLDSKYKVKNNLQYFQNVNNKELTENSLLGDIILQMRFSAKFHLQMCAVLSQSNNHMQALEHARISALICEDNIVKTYYLFTQFKKKKNLENEESPSLEEKIREVQKVVEHIFNKISSLSSGKNKNPLLYPNLRDEEIYKNNNSLNDDDLTKLSRNEELKISLRNVLGMKKSDDWINYLNIGNIMYLSALNYEDLDIDSDPKFELFRDAVLEKIVMLTVAYFCIATEIRFLETKSSSSNNNSILKKNSHDKGELWHSKAVEFSCLYLPSICPLVKHYISSYHKHYTNNLCTIPEDEIVNNHLEIHRSNFELENDTVLFIKSTNLGPPIKNLNIKGLQTETSNGVNSSDRDEKKLFKLSLSKCLNKDLEQLTSRSNNGPNINNMAEENEQESQQSSAREGKIVKSSSYKSLVKKQPLTDRTGNKESKNVFLNLESLRDKDKFPMLKLKIKASSNNKETTLNNFSSLNTFSPSNSSSKLNKLTKLYTSTNYSDLKKTENPLPTKSSTNDIQDKNNISKFTLKFKINPMSTNPLSNNKEDSNIIFSSHKLTPRGVPLSLSASKTSSSKAIIISEKSNNNLTNTQGILGTTTPTLSSSPLSPRLNTNPTLPNIKKIKDLNGLNGSNFTLSLISKGDKIKDYNNFFNTNYKKIKSINNFKNSALTSRESKDEITSLTQNNSLISSLKPKLFKNTFELSNQSNLEFEKDFQGNNTFGSRTRSKENKLKYAK